MLLQLRSMRIARYCRIEVVWGTCVPGTALGEGSGVRLATLFIVTFPFAVFATPAGISGFSGKSGGTLCTSCHSGGATPSVTLTGPSALAAGALGSYTVTVMGGTAAKVAGFDAALGGVNSGSATLTAGSGARLLNGEVVQSAAKMAASGVATFTFAVKAPLTAGPFTIFISGLAADNDLTPAGDGAGSTTLDVVVSTAGPVDAGVVTAAPAAVAPAPKPSPQSPPSIGVVDGESGCSASGGLPMVLLVAMLAVALARKRVR